MITLPAALAPWRRELEIFPPEIALCLGGWLPRLTAAVGPMRPRAADDGEPDGLDGLDRRGPYERLLLSEWGLADELPDEFLRRAAGGEHAFTALARRQSGARRRSLVLFDAGPDQLGGPRIAQLALLIVLAQRARAAGAELVWGAAQHPERQLAEVTPSSILWLLRARSLEPPGERAVDAWLERAGAARDDDVWLVGGPALRGSATAAGRVTVSDVLAVDRRAVAIAVERGGGAAARVELGPPPAPAAVRLLRDPFQVARAAPVASLGVVAPASLRFTPDGRRLLARRSDGAVVAWHVPRSPREPMGRPRVLRPGGEVIAVERVSRRSALMLIASTDGVVLLGAPSKGPGGIFFPHPAHEADRIEVDPAGRLHQMYTDGSGWLVLDRAGRLSTLVQRDASLGEVTKQIERVAAVRVVHGGGGYLFWLFDGSNLDVLRVRKHGDGLIWRAPCGEWPEVVLGAGHSGIGEAGQFAFRAGGTRWRIPASDHDGHDVTLDPGDQVLSVVHDRSHALALVAIDDERRCIAMRSATQRNAFHRAERPIVHACASPAGDLVGAIDESGLVFVYSLERRALLLVVTPDEVAGR